MTQHKSLKTKKRGSKPTVLTRMQRIDLLKEEGKYDENKNVMIHLPKTKVK